MLFTVIHYMYMYTLYVPRKINFILYFWTEPSSSKITTTIVAKEGFTRKEYNKSQWRTPKLPPRAFCPPQSIIHAYGKSTIKLSEEPRKLPPRAFCPHQSIIHAFLVFPHDSVHRTPPTQSLTLSLEIQFQKNNYLNWNGEKHLWANIRHHI